MPRTLTLNLFQYHDGDQKKKKKKMRKIMYSRALFILIKHFYDVIEKEISDYHF